MDKQYQDIKWWVDHVPDFVNRDGVEAEYYRKGYYYALEQVCKELGYDILQTTCERRRQ